MTCTSECYIDFTKNTKNKKKIKMQKGNSEGESEREIMQNEKKHKNNVIWRSCTHAEPSDANIE